MECAHNYSLMQEAKEKQAAMLFLPECCTFIGASQAEVCFIHMQASEHNRGPTAVQKLEFSKESRGYLYNRSSMAPKEDCEIEFARLC